MDWHEQVRSVGSLPIPLALTARLSGGQAFCNKPADAETTLSKAATQASGPGKQPEATC